MSTLEDSRHPPKAVVGSQVSQDEEMFGRAFDGRVIRRFMGFCRSYRVALWIAIVSVLIYTATQVAIPLVILYAIDNALVAGARDRDLLELVVLVFGAVVVLNFGANFLQENLVGRAAERVLIDLRRAMFTHLQRVSLSFMDRTEVGRLMSRLQSDVNALQEFLETSIFAVGDLVLLVGIVAVLLSLDFQLGLLTLSIVPILFVMRIIWLPRAREAFMKAREANSVANGALAEAIHGVRTVQGMVREKVNFALYNDRARQNMLAHLRAAKFAQINVPIVDTLTGGAMAIVIVVGGNQVLGGTLDLGVMVAFIFYIQRFFDPIRSLTLQYSFMQRAMVSGQRILEVLDVPIAVEDKPDAIDMKECEGSIEFENVTFGYVKDQPILRNVSFKVAPGETVALVGPTGSGKTSATALVHRFYDIWEGAVRVGGHDVRDVTQESLGQHVAMVLQEPFLFTGTVFDNIRFRCTDASRQAVIDAAKAVGAHDFIEKLPDGYETILEQRGANLSLGQRQLLSFARAIVADAKILILDEATASIDSYTEMQIQKALAKLLEGRTGLVIAHRLATIRGCDRIIVLQDGEKREEGSHDELIAAKGMYAGLYSLNYASFDDVSDELADGLADAGAST
ncbi:MAG: ABC transporter ATP-binding protein [Alphaproteobacteria bacterium]|nr:ABC transporter ATP-binding protein [Alphaproteobacteria bacterium]